MSIKLIALDLDGTMLNSAKHISERTRKALEAAAGEGSTYCRGDRKTVCSTAKRRV